MNGGPKDYQRRRRRKFFYTTSAGLPGPKIASQEYSLRSTSPCSTYRILPPRASPGRKSLLRNNPCGPRVHAQLIAYYLRGPPRAANRFSGIILVWSTSPCSTYRILPPRASAHNRFRNNPCVVHESGPRNFSLEKLDDFEHLFLM